MRGFSRNFRRIPVHLLNAGIVCLAVLPLGIVLLNLFSPPSDDWEHIVTHLLPVYTVNTLVVLSGIIPLTLFFGFGSAWIIHSFDFFGRRILAFFLILPLTIPTYIAAYAYHATFGQWIVNKLGIIWIFSSVLYPYIFLICLRTLCQESNSMIETARSLGSSAWRIALRLQIPLARPALFGGASLVVMETVNDYGAFDFFGINTFTTGILIVREQFSNNDSARLAGWLLSVIFLFVFLERKLRGRKSFTEKSNYRLAPHVRLGIVGTLIVWTCLLCPLTAGFLLPMMSLLTWSSRYIGTVDYPALCNAIVASTKLAVGAAFFVTFSGLILSGACRHYPKNQILSFLRSCLQTAYAIPGVILGIAIIMLALWIDRTILLGLVNFFSDSSRTVLYSSVIVLYYAYLVRFTSISVTTIDVAFSRFGISVSEASRSLGQSTLMTFFKVEFPMIRGSLLVSMVLVFVETLKELPLTLLMIPADVNTLATLTYFHIKNEDLGAPSVYSLVIIVVACAATLIVNKQILPSRN